MSKSSSYRSLCALMLMLVMAFSAVSTFGQAQAGSGQIVGTISDAQGAALSGAKVTAVNKGTGLTSNATTGDDGQFSIVLLPPGNYEVTIEAAGFSKTTANVEVTVGRAANLNIPLSTSGVQETVNVTAGAVQVQTTRSEADAVINERAIENLPINGRRFQDFVTLTPTAQVEPSRQQISLSGQRGIYGANVNVDGTDFNQPFFGGIRGGERSNFAFTIPQESIKEFQVVAAGYSAEFGRSTGGIVNAVTKSGSNNFHGSGFYQIRPEKLARNNFFFESLETSINPVPGTAAALTQPRREVKPAPTLHQLGGSFGGPLIQDKLFFFGAYEHQRFRNNRIVAFDTIAGVAPTVASQEAFDFFKNQEGPFKQTNDAHAVTVRGDYELSSNHRLNLRYGYSRSEALNSATAGTQLAPNTSSALSNNGTEKNNTNSIVWQMASTFGSNLINELRGQFTREERPRLSNSTQPNFFSTIGQFGAVNFLPTTQFDRRFQLADSLTYIRGNHSFKFGVEYNHISVSQQFGFCQFGCYSASGLSAAATLELLTYSPSVTTASTFVNRLDAPANNLTYQVNIGNLQAAYKTDEIAFFAQDAWRIRPNLTINYGLRWEGQYNPEADASNQPLIDKIKDFNFPVGLRQDPTQIPDSTKQFGPRLGFAYDPGSDGKTVIRGFAGIYYARSPGILFAGPFNNFRLPPGDLRVTLPFSVPAANPNKTLYQQFKLIGVDLNNFTLDTLPTVSAAQVTQIAAALGLSPDPFLNAAPILMASDFRNPRSYQAGIGIEREIARGLTLRADYSHIKTVYMQRNRELNLPAPTLRTTAVDPAQRPFFNVVPGTGSVARPIPTLGSVQVRESTAKGLYRALTLGAKFQRSKFQFNAFYTLSKNLTDDDNERDAGGTGVVNTFDLAPEYGYARIDRRHQFVANPVVTLPFLIEFSSAIRLLSGRPIDATFGSDANRDGVNNDRPYRAPGVPFERNAFRNRALSNVDVRLQKRFNFGVETRKLVLSMEIFNVFNNENIELNGTAVTNYCATTTQVNCGFLAPSNPNFLSLIDSNPTSTRFGQLLTGNLPGAPFQMQLGARFVF
jgi:outer membrane receptor for ferrienterochelin and colicin